MRLAYGRLLVQTSRSGFSLRHCPLATAEFGSKQPWWHHSLATAEQGIHIKPAAAAMRAGGANADVSEQKQVSHRDTFQACTAIVNFCSGKIIRQGTTHTKQKMSSLSLPEYGSSAMSATHDAIKLVASGTRPSFRSLTNMQTSMQRVYLLVVQSLHKQVCRAILHACMPSNWPPR